MTTVESLARDARSAAAHAATGIGTSTLRYPSGQHVSVSADLNGDRLTYRVGGRDVDEQQLRLVLLDLEQVYRG